MVHINGALVSAIQGAPECSSERTPTFKVEIKVALDVTIGLHLKMRTRMRLLVHKWRSKRWIWGYTYDFILRGTKNYTEIRRKRCIWCIWCYSLCSTWWCNQGCICGYTWKCSRRLFEFALKDALEVALEGAP